MKFKRTMAMVMATAMMMGLAACGGGSSNGGGSSAGGDDEVKIAYIVKAKSDAFWTSMEDGAESFAEEKGIHLEFQAPEKEPAGSAEAVSDRPLAEQLRDFERSVIRKTLDACGGNKTKAMERLGLSRRTFYRKYAELFEGGRVIK